MIIFEILEGPVPEWLQLLDLFYLFVAGIAVGFMLGHMLGKWRYR